MGESTTAEGPTGTRVGYGGVLVLLVASLVVTMAGPETTWVTVVSTALRGLTLVVLAAHAGVARRFLVVIGLLVVTTSAGALAASEIAAGEEVARVAGAIDLLLVGAGPVLIVSDVGRHPVVTGQTVMAALSVYLLVALFFALVLGLIATYGGGPVFADADSTSAGHLYFSLVTITTLGYGDLVPGTDFVRMVAATEALLGQIYLVTVVALVVSRLGETRGGGPSTD